MVVSSVTFFCQAFLICLFLFSFLILHYVWIWWLIVEVGATKAGICIVANSILLLECIPIHLLFDWEFRILGMSVDNLFCPFYLGRCLCHEIVLSIGVYNRVLVFVLCSILWFICSIWLRIYVYWHWSIFILIWIVIIWTVSNRVFISFG